MLLTKDANGAGAKIVSRVENDENLRKSPYRKSAEWLLEKIQEGRKKPFAEIVTLTPDIAEMLMASNPDNRRISERIVATIAADIESDRWDFNGETIIVAKDGSLNDGQHRCAAVLLAKKPVRTAIVFGAERDTRMTVDSTSVPRKVGDFLKMGGATYTAVCGSAAMYLKMHERGLKTFHSGSALITKKMIQQYYWDHSQELLEAAKATDGKIKVGIGWAPLTAAYVLISRVNPHEAAVFFQRLEDGVGLKRNDPALALRNRILTGIIKTQRFYPHQKVEMIIRYWNAYRRGDSVTRAPRLMNNIPNVEA